MAITTDKNRLIIWLIIITIFSTFLIGIISGDHLFISDRNYLLLGLCIILVYIFIRNLFTSKHLEFKVIFWEFMLLNYGIYLFLRHEDFSTISFYNSYSTLFFLLILVYYIIKHTLLNNPKSLDDLILGIGTLTLFQIIYGYLQLFNVLPTNIGTYDLEGTLLNPGVYSNFISLGILTCIGSYWFMQNGRLKSIYLITISILGLSILPFANSRTAWIAVSIGIFYLAFIKFDLWKRYQTWTITIFQKLSIFIFVLLVMVFLCWFLFTYKVDSSNGRILIWKICMQMIQKSPFVGSGTDNFLREFSHAQMEYLKNPNIDFSTKMLADRPIAAFNEYIQFTVELGLVGIAFFISLILFPLKKFKNQNSAKETCPFIAVIIAVLVMAMFSYPFRNLPTIILTFVSLAVINSYDGQKTFVIKERFVKITVLGCFLLLTVFEGYTSTVNYLYCREWKTTCLDQNNSMEKKIVLSKYEKLYLHLYKNYEFCNNHANILKFYGEYNKSIELYNKAGSVII